MNNHKNRDFRNVADADHTNFSVCKARVFEIDSLAFENAAGRFKVDAVLCDIRSIFLVVPIVECHIEYHTLYYISILACTRLNIDLFS